MDSDLAIDGAKNERAKIKELHIKLNSSDVVPEQAYRMTKGMYPLVCYINNIVALYLSKNYEPIPVFIFRAYRHMNELPATLASEAYYNLILIYLKQMSYVIKNYTSISEEQLSAFIPAEILNAGPQAIPVNKEIAA